MFNALALIVDILVVIYYASTSLPFPAVEAPPKTSDQLRMSIDLRFYFQAHFLALIHYFLHFSDFSCISQADAKCNICLDTGCDKEITQA